MEIGEHFGFTVLMGAILLTAFTAVSLVPLLGARWEQRRKEQQEES